MSILDDYAQALAAEPPTGARPAVISSVTAGSPRIVNITVDGSDEQQAYWSSAFDSVIAAKTLAGIVGLKVVVVLIQGQPYILDMIIGS